MLLAVPATGENPWMLQVHDSGWSVYADASAAEGHECRVIYLGDNDGGPGISSEACL